MENTNTEKTVVKKVSIKKAAVAKKIDKTAAKKTAAKKTDKKTTAVKKEKKFKSTSGNYKSVRSLAESMFAKNKELKHEELEKSVRKEFPMSKYTKNDYAWLKNKIISHNTWTTMDAPAWTKKPSAKIKKG